MRNDGGGVGRAPGRVSLAGVECSVHGELLHFRGHGQHSGDLLASPLCTIQREKKRVRAVRVKNKGAGQRGENGGVWRCGRARSPAVHRWIERGK